MAKPRSRRRDFVEQPPEIFSLQLRLLQYLKDNWKWFAAGLALLFIALAVFGVRVQLQVRHQQQAGLAMARVAPLLSKPESAAEALKGLDQILKDYPDSPAAYEAALFRAHLLYQTGDYAAAAKAYEALAQAPKSLGDTLVADSLSYCYEALGDFRKAAQTLTPAADKAAAPLQSELYRRLAILLEKAGAPQEAAPYWQKLADKPPDPSLLPYFKEKLAAAEGASPKKKD
jgi:predicted negative regulator of RcsB-dependent stress response